MQQSRWRCVEDGWHGLKIGEKDSTSGSKELVSLPSRQVSNTPGRRAPARSGGACQACPPRPRLGHTSLSTRRWRRGPSYQPLCEAGRATAPDHVFQTLQHCPLGLAFLQDGSIPDDILTK